MIQIINLPILMLAIVVHECAHGLVAKWCGDDTASREGRITLNPISHVDLWGTIIVPLALSLAGGFLFGWAKPVPVNPNNYRNYRRDDILVSMAGPASNFIMAFLSTLGLAAIYLIYFQPGHEGSAPEFASFAISIMNYSIQINLLLALFNLFPIPPLDGSHVVASLLPPHLGEQYRSLGFMGLFILVIMMATGVVNRALDPVFSALVVQLENFLNMIVR